MFEQNRQSIEAILTSPQKYECPKLTPEIESRHHTRCPEFKNPFAIEDSNTYYDWAHSFNGALIAHMQEALKWTTKDNAREPGWQLVTTGSDARLEKGIRSPDSKIELILLSDNETIAGAKISEKISDLLIHPYYQEYLAPNFEKKDIRQPQQLLKYVSADGNLMGTYPNRLSGARPLCGDDRMLNQAKSTLADYIINNPKGGELIRELRKRHLDVFKNCFETGINQHKGQPAKQYDWEQGIAYYNPQQQLFGFKYGPLRYLQTAIELAVLHATRTSRSPVILENLPPNPVESIYFLSNLSLTNQNNIATPVLQLTEQEITDLSESYKYFIHLHHQTQYRCHYEGQSAMPFDRDTARSHAQHLETLVTKGFKIK